MTPYKVWLLTAPVLVWSILLIPSIRLVTIPILIIHQLLLVIGINNLRINFFHKSHWKGNRDKKEVALTFDDGPDPSLTPHILDLLKKYDVEATFFLIGNKVKDQNEIIKRIISEGHTIASHDLTHALFSNFRKRSTIDHDLTESIKILEEASGKRVRLYRPPVGLGNPNYKDVLKSLDLESISWSYKPYDAGNRRVGGIKAISYTPKNGDIILLHDALPIPQYRDLILNKLEELINKINKAELKPVTVDKLLNLKAYK